MIKVTLNEESKQPVRPFPKYMQTDSGYLVLFTEFGKGICLKRSPDAVDKIGAFDDSWNMANFYDYNEPITTQNA